MDGNTRGAYSAAPSALGYVYQIRYALLEALRRLKGGQDFSVSIETLDDVVFQADGEPLELFQTKHHLGKSADLTDASPDLWKTLRIWSSQISSNSLPDGAILFLITTATAATGHAAFYLTGDETRDVSAALQRLNATAESSTSKENEPAYLGYRGLSPNQRTRLLASIYVVAAAPTIADVESALRNEVFFAVKQKYLDSFLQRLEGWWFRRAITHLLQNPPSPVLSEEFASEVESLREQFKQDNLPIDDDIMSASVDASGYQDHAFVHQLRLIQLGNPRILFAITNYFRAFTHRSRWVREDLLLIGELERYEDRLAEEWELLFEQMRDDLGDEPIEEAKLTAANTLYKWVETASHVTLRPGVIVRCLAIFGQCSSLIRGVV